MTVRTRNKGTVVYRRVAIAMVALMVLVADKVGAQSLEEQMRRPPGTSTLDYDSERLRGSDPDDSATESLDDGSLQGGDRPDPD